jgi:hypothetical protein
MCFFIDLCSRGSNYLIKDLMQIIDIEGNQINTVLLLIFTLQSI